ncbi:MAG: rhomboid family intramembrane serine protease [Bacteroidetes bacterium]|jgi:membrane associated rhomboid family serine protease|nr:rhomboid family intramembrane serine protease [Bacteroidota bacterium]
MNNSIFNDIKLQVLQGRNTIVHLIAINVGLFLVMAIPLGILSVLSPHAMRNTYAWITDWLFIPADPMVFFTRPWTLITHFFLHSFSIGHILWNMLIFFWFGRIYHNLLGNQRSLQLYLLAGMAGGLAYLISAQVLPTISGSGQLVGASGAIMGFVVAATTLSPTFTIRLLFFGDIKLWMIAAFMIVSDLVFLAENTGGRVAHLAGGFMGYLFVTQLRQGRDLGRWITQLLGTLKGVANFEKKTRFQVHRGKSSHSATQPVGQEQIDAILDKILRTGYDSLSQREKDILFRSGNSE